MDGWVCSQNLVRICKICNKTLSSKFYLTIHERRHSGYKPYSCSTCQKSFVSQGNLVDHTKTHEPRVEKTPKQREKCHLCDRTYSSKGNLTLHLKKHYGTAKKFSCKLCNKELASASHLAIYIGVHLPIFNQSICQQSLKLSHICNLAVRDRVQVQCLKKRKSLTIFHRPSPPP